MQVIRRRKQAVNITKAERVLSAVAGGALAGLGLRKRSVGGVALALLGGDLLRRGVSGHCYLYEAFGFRTVGKGQGGGTTLRVDKSVTIGKPRSEVYQFWRALSNLPRFMKHVQSVQESDGGKSHWVVTAPAGRTVEWDAEVYNEQPNELIAWRSLPGADVNNAGSVAFKDAPGGRGTEVKVELQYNPPAGRVGAAVAWLWGEEPEMQVQDDLHRLKQLLETGEVPTTEGQSSGRVVKHSRPAARKNEHDIQHSSEASFPASDAPAYNL